MGLCPNCFTNSYFQNQCGYCGYRQTKPRESRALPLGMILKNRYVIGRILGVGGFGITYVCYDLTHKRKSAIKEYFPAEWAVRSQNRCTIQPTSQERDRVYKHGCSTFINEGKILYGLKNVENVVKVRDFFYENGTAYMVMELLNGTTLSGYMRQQQLQCMPYEQAGRILEEIGNTLVKVHSQMLLHRDISPDNIMVTSDGNVKLIDFGSTRVYALNSLQSMSVFVKPGFAPPEQYSRSGQGPWTDVYALAATYYYIVTGKKIPGAPDRMMGTPVPTLKTLIPGIPAQISAAIDHALRISWRERPQTMQQFLNEFSAGLKDRAVNRTPTRPPEAHEIEIIQNATQYKTTIPSILLKLGNFAQRYSFPENRVLRIGRNPSLSDIVLSDAQIGRNHCNIQYSAKSHQFLVTNNSKNQTFTSRGNIRAGDSVILIRGDWIYIQTARDRYIFYMEEE